MFAAVSLADVLNEIGADYATNTGTPLSFNFAASSLLARQIEEGASADLFISADEAKMDHLQKLGLIDIYSRTNLVSNQLVAVVHRDSNLKLSSARDLWRAGRIAIAEWQSVPAGIYARQYLQREQLWNDLAPKMVPTQNVRGALAAVESGNADAAIVYSTDAAISKDVKITFAVPPGEGPRISYPAAVLADTQKRAEALHFLDYLSSPAAIRAFDRHGFAVRNTGESGR